jgi:hypothetical protein
MLPFAALHNGLANGIDADARVLGRRCNNWIQVRWGSFGDIFLYLYNRARELPLRNHIGFREDRLERAFKPRGSLHRSSSYCSIMASISLRPCPPLNKMKVRLSLALPVRSWRCASLDRAYSLWLTSLRATSATVSWSIYQDSFPRCTADLIKVESR